MMTPSNRSILSKSIWCLAVVFLLGSFYLDTQQSAYPGVVVREAVTLSTPDGGVVTGLRSTSNATVTTEQPFSYLTNGYHHRSVGQHHSELLTLQSTLRENTELEPFVDLVIGAGYVQNLLPISLHDPAQIQKDKDVILNTIAELRTTVAAVAETEGLSENALQLVNELSNVVESAERLIFNSSEPRAIRSYFNGTVVEVLVTNGDTVLPGASLATVQLEPASVSAFLMPEDLGNVEVGNSVEIHYLSEVVEGMITTVGNNVTALPTVLNATPYQNATGILVTIQPQSPITWPTGVPVDITLL